MWGVDAMTLVPCTPWLQPCCYVPGSLERCLSPPCQGMQHCMAGCRGQPCGCPKTDSNCCAGEGPGTPSWLLESADGARAAPAGKDQGPEREDRPGQGEIGEDGLEHYDVTPDPTKRRLSLTPQSTRWAAASRADVIASAQMIL